MLRNWLSQYMPVPSACQLAATVIAGALVCASLLSFIAGLKVAVAASAVGNAPFTASQADVILHYPLPFPLIAGGLAFFGLAWFLPRSDEHQGYMFTRSLLKNVGLGVAIVGAVLGL